MIEVGTLVRVKSQKTQLGSPIENDPDWTYPEIMSGELATVVGRMIVDWEAVIVLASVDGTPRVGWLYDYEVEQVHSATDNMQRR